MELNSIDDMTVFSSYCSFLIGLSLEITSNCKNLLECGVFLFFPPLSDVGDVMTPRIFPFCLVVRFFSICVRAHLWGFLLNILIVALLPILFYCNFLKAALRNCQVYKNTTCMSLASCYIFKQFDFFKGWSPCTYILQEVFNLAEL